MDISSRIALTAVLCAALSAQAPAPSYAPLDPLAPATIRIARIRVHVSEGLATLPNFTCLQTIERSRRPPRSRRFQPVDTIRLEVAFVDGKELFAWPGSRNFDERPVTEMVKGGAIGNGQFALHAKSVFQSNNARIEFESERREGAATIWKFRYEVPRLRSGYTIKVGDQQGVVGYRGYFEVESLSLDLRTLTVDAIEIPPNLEITAANTRITYQTVNIGGRDTVLPLASEMSLIGNPGDESRNRITFAGCRQYAGESVLIFEDPPPESAAPVSSTVVDLPPDATLYLALNNTLRVGEMAIGDPISATLTSDVRRNKRLLLPKGARFTGRITARETVRGTRQPTVSVVFLFDRFSFPGAEGVAAGTLDDAGPLAIGGRVSVSPSGVLYLMGGSHVLPKGFRIVWRTPKNSAQGINPQGINQ